MEHPYRELAQQIANHWLSTNETSLNSAFASILEAQLLGWAEKDVKKLINTALCFCWANPKLLKFLDFEKRKNAVIANFDDVVNNAQLANKANALMVGCMLVSDNSKVDYRVNIGFWGVEGIFHSGSRKKKKAIAEKITPELIQKAENSNDFSEINAIIAEFKACLPEFLAIENCSADITVYYTVRGLDIDHYFSDADKDTADLIRWNTPAKFAPRLTEYVFNNLDKFIKKFS